MFFLKNVRDRTLSFLLVENMGKDFSIFQKFKVTRTTLLKIKNMLSQKKQKKIAIIVSVNLQYLQQNEELPVSLKLLCPFTVKLGSSLQSDS